jgi:hypothetical protein
MSLKNLNEIANEAQTSFLNYKKEEIELSDNFKKLFTQIIESDGRQKISFSKHTTIVFTSKELTITFPNQWYYIASYFVDYLITLFEYGNNFDKIFKSIDNPKNTIAEIKKSNQIPQNIQTLINKHFSLDQDREYFQKFISDYNWWYGSKTIDRNDYFVSPILELANVVNNSQSYIADLAYHLSLNPNLFELLNESKLSEFKPEQFGKESLTINAKKYINEKYTGRFVYKVIKFFYDLDKLDNITSFFFKNTKPEYTSIKDQEIKLTSIFKTSVSLLPKDELSFNDGKTRFFEDIIFRLEDENYYLSTEWTDGKDSRLDLDNFQLLIEKYYPDYSIYTEKEVHYLSSKINKSKEISQEIFDISTFQQDCVFSGLNYKPELITRYISSLATKPFVLLSGLSGSGKTKLAQAYAQWICESEEQYCIVPVGADWTNREPLLGYVNALENTEYILPENGALDLIIKANDNPKKPYFLILDEMNLSHVERYFADFLSVMESNDTFKLHSSQKSLNNNENEKYDKLLEVPKEIGWPDNLFVVGTVNIDETTYMFSPKVLDRANVIEFRVSEDDLENYFKPETNPLNMKKLWVEGIKTGLGAVYAEDFVKISIEKTKKDNLESINDELIKFFKKLQPISAEFGYRTASEIQTLFGMVDIINPKYDKSEDFIETYPKNYDFKIDVAIMQKLLPKIHGSRRKLSTPLTVLANLCLKEDTNNIFKENGEINITTDKIKYPLSFYKIARMYKNAIENGFASYAEA